jgi:NAD(P)-dependent dehydrogenase (short-subunit alcohol dehydrogenase family)
MTTCPPGSLDGQVALVTGATSGIGRAIALRLAAEGVEIAVVAGSAVSRAVETADVISHAGGQATAFQADVSKGDQVKRLVDEVASRLGAPDILVNSAGVWFETPLSEPAEPAGDGLTEDELDRMVDINLKGVVRMTAAVAPLMVRRGSGRIVNIASAAGIAPSARFSLYAATKAGVIAFTKAAALELAPANVAVNAIAPGNTATPINAHVRLGPDQLERRDWIRRTTPSTRLFTPPEEIAEAALVLVDGRITGFHGAVLSIDEGRTAGITLGAG